MDRDTQPRAEFAASLREWFVAEMKRPDQEDDDADEPVGTAHTLVDLEDDDRTRPNPPRWLLLAQAAAVLAIVAGLWWVTDRISEPTTPATAPATPTTIAPEPSAVARQACEDFRAGAVQLSLGASPDDIAEAALDVRARLTAATERLDELPVALTEPRRLAAEAIDAVDRLIAVAGEDRVTVDSAVRNLDLIVAAWSRELSNVAGGGACDDLPTLREVF